MTKIARHTLPREQRITSKREVDQLFKATEAGLVYPLRYLLLVGEESIDMAHPKAHLTLLVTAPKRNHKRAHTRNLLKRRIREAYRQAAPKAALLDYATQHNKHLSLGLIYIGKEVEAYSLIEASVTKILQKILRHAQ